MFFISDTLRMPRKRRCQQPIDYNRKKTSRSSTSGELDEPSPSTSYDRKDISDSSYDANRPRMNVTSPQLPGSSHHGTSHLEEKNGMSKRTGVSAKTATTTGTGLKLLKKEKSATGTPARADAETNTAALNPFSTSHADTAVTITAQSMDEVPTSTGELDHFNT